MSREGKSDSVMRKPDLGPCHSSLRSTHSTPSPVSNMGGPSPEALSPYSAPPPLSNMDGPSLEAWSPYSTPPPLSNMGGPSFEAGSPLMENQQRVPRSSHVISAVRRKVINDRIARGAEEIKVEFNTPVKHELTEEEKEKKARRRKQNREAAHRCRLKKKRSQCGTNEELGDLRETNSDLQAEVELLRQEVENLKRIEREHRMSGQCLRYPQGQPCAPRPGIHPHTDHHTDHCPPGNVSDHHDDTRCPGLPRQYPTVQVPGDAYSPVSDVSGGSPCPDHQVPHMMDNQWMTTSRNLESFFQGTQANMDVPPFPGVKTEGCDTRPSCQTDHGVQISNRHHADRAMNGRILRNDAWLNVGDDVNRITPDIPHDNNTFYATSHTNDVMKPEADVRPLGEIGIPSLDNISVDQLIPANIDFSRYLPTQRN